MWTGGATLWMAIVCNFIPDVSILTYATLLTGTLLVGVAITALQFFWYLRKLPTSDDPSLRESDIE